MECVACVSLCLGSEHQQLCNLFRHDIRARSRDFTAKVIIDRIVGTAEIGILNVEFFLTLLGEVIDQQREIGAECPSEL